MERLKSKLAPFLMRKGFSLLEPKVAARCLELFNQAAREPRDEFASTLKAVDKAPPEAAFNNADDMLNWLNGPKQTELKCAYNDGYTHEALHITHVLLCTFNNHVMETRCADQFPDVKAATDKVHQAMFDLYQLISTKFEDN